MQAVSLQPTSSVHRNCIWALSLSRNYVKRIQNSRQTDNSEHDHAVAAIAQLRERQTEDLNLTNSIPGLGICEQHYSYAPGVRSLWLHLKLIISIIWHDTVSERLRR